MTKKKQKKQKKKGISVPDRRAPLEDFFVYCCGFVSEQNISNLTGPSDPGTGSYIQTFCEVLRSRSLPDGPNFDLLEATHYNWWCPDNSTSFRRFRMWTNAIALGIDELENNNAFATLVDDVIALGDQALAQKTDAALGALDVYGETRLFLLLSRILLAGTSAAPPASVSSWTAEFKTGRARLVDDSILVWRKNPLSLVAGIPTVFDQLESTWDRLIKAHIA